MTFPEQNPALVFSSRDINVINGFHTALTDIYDHNLPDAERDEMVVTCIERRLQVVEELGGTKGNPSLHLAVTAEATGVVPPTEYDKANMLLKELFCNPLPFAMEKMELVDIVASLRSARLGEYFSISKARSISERLKAETEKPHSVPFKLGAYGVMLGASLDLEQLEDPYPHFERILAKHAKG